MIDGRIPRHWPPEVIEAVRRYRQGHLVERPPFSYVRSRRHRVWAVDPDPGEGGDQDEDWVDLSLDERPPYGLVTTQTCDLYEERRDPRQPWLMVAPVYDASAVLNRGQRGHLDSDRIRHLVRLDHRDLPEGLWVADLRIEFPLEKGWLVGRDPIEAFDSETRYQVLADRLASRRARPAVATLVMELVVTPLREFFTGAGARWAAEVDSVRVQISGSPLLPTAARLLVLTDEDALPPEARQALDEWWNTVVARAGGLGLALLANHYATLDELSAREYAGSLRLDFDYLSPDE